MIRRDPIEGHEDEEETLLFIIGGAGGLFESLGAALDGRLLSRSIRAGRAAPQLFETPPWSRAVLDFAAEGEDLLARVAESGIRSGLEEVAAVNGSSSALVEQIPVLAQDVGAKSAIDLAEAIDDGTRAGVQKLIEQAAAQYRKTQDASLIPGLAAEIRDRVGVTEKQAARIGNWETAARASGMDEKLVAQGVSERMASAKAIRAQAIAERGVVEQVNRARHESWLAARDAGELPEDVLKRWMDQGDEHVRATHRAQTRRPPIPLDAIFEIQGVLYPPSPDRGCRCWSILVKPSERAGQRRDDAEAEADRQRAADDAQARDQRLAAARERTAANEPRRRALEEAAAERRRLRLGGDAAAPVPSAGAVRPAPAPARVPTAEEIEAAYRADARKLQSAWVHGSRNKTSIHLQEAIRRELGIDVALWNKRGFEIQEDLVERYRPVVRRMYDETQAALREAGILDVFVYRGGRSTAIPLRGVVESWTDELAVAEKFATRLAADGGGGVVMKLQVQREQIFLWHKGPNWKNAPRYGEQFEWVILGGAPR